jgi:hypothetical protein
MVYMSRELCGGPKAWDTCQNITWMVQQAEANGVILATIPLAWIRSGAVGTGGPVVSKIPAN